MHYQGHVHDLSDPSFHAKAEQPPVEDKGPPQGVSRDSFAGPVHVEWDTGRRWTPLVNGGDKLCQIAARKCNSPVPAPGEVDAAPWSGETRFEVGRYSVGRRVSFEQFSSRIKAVGRAQQQAEELGLRVTYFTWRERPDGVFNGLSVEEIRIERTPGTSIQIYRALIQKPGPSSPSD